MLKRFLVVTLASSCGGPRVDAEPERIASIESTDATPQQNAVHPMNDPQVVEWWIDAPGTVAPDAAPDADLRPDASPPLDAGLPEGLIEENGRLVMLVEKAPYCARFKNMRRSEPQSVCGFSKLSCSAFVELIGSSAEPCKPTSYVACFFATRVGDGVDFDWCLASISDCEQVNDTLGDSPDWNVRNDCFVVRKK